MFFQPIPAKDKITFTNKEDVLTVVDFQEIVKAGGRIIRILDGIVYEENCNTPPYRDYILILKDLRNKYKRDGNIKRWEKSFTNGIVIPKDDDKQKKVFRSYLNLVKRKKPGNEGIMYRYGEKNEENYEFDDFDYLTIQEENEECLITQ
ncbi:hypothetical protein LOTGIDRAFT_165501 [Lottia gigantea]|uniref:Uncharacterized protein n=1 Tax=Lottia gigantea TaxID=225164 RepID=V3ZWF0_LOTGI|nr:hypothetical protein LOTGIDRAFT_165501 [Lottia gigantea]ESO88717.1 hypothetical protein LOTGIDRAFT_165501 [Lottia gigantea]